MKTNFRLFFLLIFFQSFSQTIENQEKISNLLENYFSYDREIIHVQFNKILYVNNEIIAYKGYVLAKNTTIPNLNTTNIDLVIYNDKQEIVLKQLLYANDGTFDSNLQLDKKFTSGKYYFHFFTNWMNNFKEDDSFMQTIKVIDENENYNLKLNEPNLATATIKLFPESGIIVDNITNIVGLKLTDCNNVGISINNGVLVDSKSNEITQFSTNKMGDGILHFIPQLNEKYYVKIKNDKLNLSQQLPNIQPTGLIVSYNNNLPNNILAINIHTNEIGVEQYKNKKFTLLIHQNKFAIKKDISFENKKPDQIIRFDKKVLANGVNIIRVLDENLKEVAERLLYYDKNPKQNINFEVRPIGNDSITLYGKCDKKMAKLSISVLAELNACNYQKRTIQGTFLLNAYLENPEMNDYAYFDPENTTRKQDLELLMLNQEKSKYNWENILAEPPKIKYDFKKGVTINGMVEKNWNPKIKYKISLFSLKDNVIEETNLYDNNKFKFENFYAKDATTLLFQLSGDKDSTIKSKITAHVIPLDDHFEGNLKFEKNNCPILKKQETTFNFKDSIRDKNVKILETVVIKNTSKKDVFLHQKDSDMMNATAYKIKNEFGTMLDFLNKHGYKAALDATNSVSIKSNRNFTENEKLPDVFIDDFLLTDLNPLFSLQMEDVDEVYIDKMGFSGSVGSDGVIKIFMKPNTKKDFYDPKFTTLIVASGFTKKEDYKNSTFQSPKEFFTFGTLKWEPNIPIIENQNFNLKFDCRNQKKIQVQIEGFDANGELYSEIKTLTVTNP